MNTRYKRTISARLTRYYDDLSWKWQRHKEGFVHGALFGGFIVLMAFYFAWGV